MAKESDDIPAFLKIPQEQRNATWEKNPPKALPRIQIKPSGRRVYARYWPDRFGTVIKEGPQVSEVKWDNGSTSDSFVPNDKLENISTKPASSDLLPKLRHAKSETSKLPTQEKDMSANQVTEYNELVAKALALGLKAATVKRFKNSAAGEKRLADLKASIQLKENNTEPGPDAPVETAPEASAEVGQPEETKVAKKTKAKKTGKAKAKANGNGGIRPGSKLETIANLMKRKSGCTEAECAKAVGWAKVNMSLQAKHAGLKLRREKNKDGVSRYYGE